MAINPALVMMLIQQAPRLMAAIKGNGGLESVPNIANALESGMDTGLMQEGLNGLTGNSAISALDKLNSNYIVPDVNQAFPSDGASQLELQTLAERLLKYGNNSIGDNGEPALMSAAIMSNNPQPTPTSQPSSNPLEGGIVPLGDSDMDDIHSNEMWENGYGYQHPLKDWFKNNKR